MGLGVLELARVLRELRYLLGVLLVGGLRLLERRSCLARHW